MSAEFKKIFGKAHQLASAYRARATSRKPAPEMSSQDVFELFDGPTPEHGEDGLAVIDSLAKAAEPGLMTKTGKRFFSWVIGASNPVGVAADWLVSAWGQSAGLYATSPAGAMVEKAAAKWLLDVLCLPENASVGFVTGATMANFVGLAVGRNEVLLRAGYDLEARGLSDSPKVRVLVGADAHSTIYASLRYLGFGTQQIEVIATNDQGAIEINALEATLEGNQKPVIVAAQAGQINTGAFDPIGRIAQTCKRYNSWLHVDGAFGLWARACPDRAFLAEGLENADSWATDAHKWLQAPYDSGLIVVRDAEAHSRAMSIKASYLPTDPLRYDPSNYTPELSRRSRGFVIWALLRHLGSAGIAKMVSLHCRLARRACDNLVDVEGIEVVNEVVLNQLILRFSVNDSATDNDQATHRVISEIQNRNEVFVEGASWRGQWVMRISIISQDLQDEDIDRLTDEIKGAWRAIRKAL